MFDEELITWSVDGGGNLFYRPKHKFSVTNVGGLIRILDKTNIDCKYLFYVLTYLHSQITFDWVFKAHPSVIRKVYNHIPLLSINEQKEIVEKLDKAFDEIDLLYSKTNHKISLISELQKILLDKIVSAKKSLIDGRLGDYCKITSSKRIFKNEYVKKGIPFYRTKELKELANNRSVSTELFISESRYNELKSQFGVPSVGDILISAVGTIGELLVIQKENNFYFKDGNIVWLREISDQINSQYLALCLKNKIKELNDTAQGSAYSALTIEKLVKVKVPIISLNEQEQVVNEYKSMEKELDVINKNLRVLQNYINDLRKSILYDLFSNEKKVA